MDPEGLKLNNQLKNLNRFTKPCLWKIWNPISKRNCIALFLLI